MNLKILFLLASIASIAMGCFNRNTSTISNRSTDTVDNNGSITSKEMNTIEDKSLNELRTYYLDSEKSYINNPKDWGVGVVNPKDFSFTLILDTVSNLKNHIEDIETQEFIIPLLNKPDYLVFYIVAKNIHAGYYEIYLNKRSIGYVLKNEFDFYSWTDFLMKTLSIRAKKGVIDRNNPESIVTFEDSVIFKVLEVDEDWLFAKEIIETMDENDKLGETGYWIRWKDKNSLLISPSFIM